MEITKSVFLVLHFGSPTNEPAPAAVIPKLRGRTTAGSGHLIPMKKDHTKTYQARISLRYGNNMKFDIPIDVCVLVPMWAREQRACKCGVFSELKWF